MTEILKDVWREYRATNIKPGSIVLDIGSSEGYFTDWARSYGANVFAYDARYSAAVGPFDGWCTVKGEGLGAYIIPGKGPCPMVSLATILQPFENVDYLKCDIEGGEYLIDWNIPTVQQFGMEFHAWTTPDKPVEGLGVRDTPMPHMAVAKLLSQLTRTHDVQLVGNTEAGGYIYGTRR